MRQRRQQRDTHTDAKTSLIVDEPSLKKQKKCLPAATATTITYRVCTPVDADASDAELPKTQFQQLIYALCAKSNRMLEILADINKEDQFKRQKTAVMVGFHLLMQCNNGNTVAVPIYYIVRTLCLLLRIADRGGSSPFQVLTHWLTDCNANVHEHLQQEQLNYLLVHNRNLSEKQAMAYKLVYIVKQNENNLREEIVANIGVAAMYLYYNNHSHMGCTNDDLDMFMFKLRMGDLVNAYISKVPAGELTCDADCVLTTPSKQIPLQTFLSRWWSRYQVRVVGADKIKQDAIKETFKCHAQLNCEHYMRCMLECNQRVLETSSDVAPTLELVLNDVSAPSVKQCIAKLQKHWHEQSVAYYLFIQCMHRMILKAQRQFYLSIQSKLECEQ